MREVLNIAKLTHSLEQAFHRKFENTVKIPTRTRMELPSGVLLIMPCCDMALDVFGVKLVTIGNAPDRVRADYYLYDSARRKCLATISADYLTDLRTAAISAIATKLLAAPESRILGVFGTGRQAWSHVVAVSATLPLTTILCCGSGQQKSKQFAERIKIVLGLEAHSCLAEHCVLESDVICCCTTSPVPLFNGALVKEGTHINAVGAFEKGNRELDAITLQRSRLYVETYEGALSEGGDVAFAIDEGTISTDHVKADLHELLNDQTLGRKHDTDITLFKSVGCAYEDLIAATLVYDGVAGDFSHEQWSEEAQEL